MRIRSTRPAFWKSKTIASVSWDARLVLKALESYVDDNGVGKDDPELFISETFSRDHFRNPPETVRRVLEAVTELHSVGLISRYEMNGEELIYVERWKEQQYIQKPQKGRFPRPDGTYAYEEDVNHDDYQIIHEPSGKSTDWSRGVEEERSRGGEDTSEVADAPSDPTPDPNDRDDVQGLLDHLDSQIVSYDPEAKVPSRTKANADAARLLLDKDGRSVDQIKSAIDYSQHSEFWRPNIRSMSKLREKYDQLRLNAQRDAHQTSSPSQRRLAQGMDLIEQTRAQSTQPDPWRTHGRPQQISP